MRKFKLTLSLIILLAIFFLIFRTPLLQGVGNFLVYENPMEPVQAVFVLSGDAWDRGNEAAKLYKDGLTNHIICTGENVPRLFLIAKIEYLESELTKMHLLSLGIPEDKIILLKKGTSTREESDYILDYCLQNNLKKVAVLSTKFHTRRIKRTFVGKFKKNNIELIIRGAPSTGYDEDYWWHGENGLIFVNNEYIKIMYYWLKS